MDKSVILAVAGSGKTTHIIKRLNREQRFLIVTYTNSNVRNLKQSIIEKFGHFPKKNIELHTYFKFIYDFCFKPLLGYMLQPQGVSWNRPPQWTNRKKINDISRYVSKDKNGQVYGNRMAKLLEVVEAFPDISARLTRYYDCICIDEIQDFGGHDFNLLDSIIKAETDILLVGDFYQHTFDTSRDGATNKNLHKDYTKYLSRFKEFGLELDTETLSKSHRCSPTICRFISEKLGIQIGSHRDDETEVIVIQSEETADNIFHNNEIVKLFFRENYRYNCYSKNWGDSKGENIYTDVCVVLNATTLNHFEKRTLHELAPTTKNKLYVACSRAKRNLYFVPEVLLKKHKQVKN